MPTFINNRTGDRVVTTLDRKQLVEAFEADTPDDNWIWFWIAKRVEERRSAAPGVAPARQEMMSFLDDLFLYAVGMGLKKPMIRLVTEGRRYKLYLSKRGTLCIKSGMVHTETRKPIGDEEYVGCLFDGRFLPNRGRQPLAAELRFLDRMNQDPVGFMAECSRDMDRCCYCNLPLEDPRSKQAGYGPICADRWGLPWGAKADEKVPSFAQLWSGANVGERRNIRQICEEIRENPRDPLTWSVLGDALEEAGHTRRPQMPERGVVVPCGSGRKAVTA